MFQVQIHSSTEQAALLNVNSGLLIHISSQKSGFVTLKQLTRTQYFQ